MMVHWNVEKKTVVLVGKMGNIFSKEGNVEDEVWGPYMRALRADNQRRLQAIKDKLDLYGEESLNREEREIVRLFPDFFYPERG